MRQYTREEVNQMLREKVGDGPVSRYAEEIGVNRQYLADVLADKRTPGPKILTPLGLRCLRSINHLYVKVTR